MTLRSRSKAAHVLCSQAQCGQLLSQGLTGCSPVGPEQPLTADTQKLGSLIGTNWQCLCRPVLCAQSCELIVMPNDPPGQINTNNPLSRLSSSLTIENLELGKTVAQSDGGGVQGKGSNSDTQLLLSSHTRPAKNVRKNKSMRRRLVLPQKRQRHRIQSSLKSNKSTGKCRRHRHSHPAKQIGI